MPWAGLYNAISCQAAHHFAEGRWIANREYLSAYARYWFECGKDIRRYTFGPAHSILEFYKTSGDKALLAELYQVMKANVAEWEKSHLDSDIGLFWQNDDRDGMEISISGALYGPNGYRATINSHMYGEYAALSSIAKILGFAEDSQLYARKAEYLKKLINERLWDPSARFYKVVPRGSTKLSEVRELHGYTPWLYGIPPESYADAFKFLSDAGVFKAPFGPTSAEQGHPNFSVSYSGHECQWNGPSWPFATSATLNALANFINSRPTPPPWASKNLYFDTLQTYAMSQHRTLPSGKRVMWIDENLNPYTGDWISRTRLEDGGHSWAAKNGGRERGKDYNHSQFCNHVISELAGVRPNVGPTVNINPLAPDSWDWFYLGNIHVKGRVLTVFFDRDGTRYGKGAGLFALVDGKLAGRSKKMAPLLLDLE